MDKSKIIPIILLVIILGVGFVGFSFYLEKEQLRSRTQELEAEKTGLAEANSNLQYKLSKIEKEKEDIARRVAIAKEEISRVESEMESWKRKWSLVSKERDELVDKMKSASVPEVKFVEKEDTGVFSEDHWADFVKSKASLEVKLDILSKSLFEERNKIAKLDKENKELSIEIDQLTKEKERLLEERKFKERTLRIMSMDLVAEREGRVVVVGEVKKLRKENLDLKRELIIANKNLMKLQDTLKEAVSKKGELEDKIADADTILKEKSIALEELQTQLEQTIDGGRKVTEKESASVELPPIVVKPSAPGLKDLKGEIIAVNQQEKFVVVDRGETSGLKPGILLKIMRGDKEIGKAVVIETRKEISAADIKEVVDGCTVQEGDIAIAQ